jgi:integrase
MHTRTPSYCLHKASGLAVVRIDGRDHYLGAYGSAESREAYDRLIAEWLANGRRLAPQTVGDNEATVNELAAAFFRHVEQHHRRPDGTQTDEVKEYRMALRPLKHLYGNTVARGFGPMALKAVRKLLVEGYDHPTYGPQQAVCRNVVNQRVGRLKRMFKWGVENEMVPATILTGLQAVRGLQRGRTVARETEPVRPVHPDTVEHTLPFLNRHLAAMVRLQMLTGMRPGEVCVMRGIDLDPTGKVWLYRPESHKTAHHGHKRVIALGPKAQEVIRPFLKLDLLACLFSPQDAMQERWERQRTERKTKVQPSQFSRKKQKPKRKPGGRYTRGSYAHAICKACDEGFPPPMPLAKRDSETRNQWEARLTAEQKAELLAWRKAHRWHPHQLRHTAATAIRKEFGLDVARVILGHRSPQITELYAELDTNRAAEVAEKIG